MNYISNAFATGMLRFNCKVEFTFCTVSQARVWAHFNKPKSYVGHEDTAAILSEALGRIVEKNRDNLTLEIGDQLLVAQYSGPRLPEGATTLPEGASIRWAVATVYAPAPTNTDEDDDDR